MAQAWFRRLPPHAQADLTKACRLYSFQFDQLLNAIYRNQPLPRVDLKQLNNAEFVSSFENKLCTVTGEKIINRLVGPLVQFIHDVFAKDYYTLTKPTILYRGLILPKGAPLSLDFKGITSMSMKRKHAAQFTFVPHDTWYDARIHDGYLLQIVIPAGTRVIPMNICALQEESEMAVLNQGRIRVTSEAWGSMVLWNAHVDLDGQVVESNEGRARYRLIRGEFLPDGTWPIFKKRRILTV